MGRFSSRIGDGWTDVAEIKEPDPHKCVSVGFLIKENKRGKILLRTIADINHEDDRHSLGGIMI